MSEWDKYYPQDETRILPLPYEREQESPSSVWSTQIGGSHYKDMAIQPTEYIVKNGLNFVEGNVIKYVTRYRHKGGLQDLEKARHYLDILIELERDNLNGR